MSYSPITVANYFIKKYSENGQLTPMKLIKLTYIANGWYMAISKSNSKLIEEDAQAWDFGPVYTSLYNCLKKYGSSIIKEPIVNNTNEIISDLDATFLDRIWQIYGDKDGVYLSAITHTDGTPWSITYPKGFNLTIPSDLILQHYKSKIKVPQNG